MRLYRNKETFEYCGSIHQLRHWSQKLLDTSLLLFTVSPVWWRMWMGWDVILIRLFIITLFKFTICELMITYNDYLLIVMILLQLVLTHLVSFPWHNCFHNVISPSSSLFYCLSFYHQFYLNVNFTIRFQSFTETTHFIIICHLNIFFGRLLTL